MGEAGRALRRLCRAGALTALACGGAGPGTGQDRTSVCGAPGILGERVARIEGPGACGIRGPVRVRSVAGVALEPPPVLACATAKALAEWIERDVKPEIARTGGRLAGLDVAAGYVCRNVNNAREGRLSEHARGGAVDVSAFRTRSGRVIRVESGWRDPRDGATLARVHAAACGTFATTLGPGSDGRHDDHLHYDLAERDGEPYCR